MNLGIRYRILPCVQIGIGQSTGFLFGTKMRDDFLCGYDVSEFGFLDMKA